MIKNIFGKNLKKVYTYSYTLRNINTYNKIPSKTFSDKVDYKYIFGIRKRETEFFRNPDSNNENLNNLLKMAKFDKSQIPQVEDQFSKLPINSKLSHLEKMCLIFNKHYSPVLIDFILNEYPKVENLIYLFKFGIIHNYYGSLDKNLPIEFYERFEKAFLENGMFLNLRELNQIFKHLMKIPNPNLSKKVLPYWERCVLYSLDNKIGMKAHDTDRALTEMFVNFPENCSDTLFEKLLVRIGDIINQGEFSSDNLKDVLFKLIRIKLFYNRQKKTIIFSFYEKINNYLFQILEDGLNRDVLLRILEIGLRYPHIFQKNNIGLGRMAIELVFKNSNSLSNNDTFKLCGILANFANNIIINTQIKRSMDTLVMSRIHDVRASIDILYVINYAFFTKNKTLFKHMEIKTLDMLIKKKYIDKDSSKLYKIIHKFLQINQFTLIYPLSSFTIQCFEKFIVDIEKLTYKKDRKMDDDEEELDFKIEDIIEQDGNKIEDSPSEQDGSKIEEVLEQDNQVLDK